MSEEENFRSSLQRGTRASSASFINQVTKSESSHSQNQSEISQRDVTTLQSVNELENHGFSIGKKLNSGSFSRVHQAKHNNVDCAVKIINLGMATSNFIYKLLPREIVILKKLNHPNIIFLHEIFLIQPNLYIFMELADGGDLLDFIVSKGALTEAKAKEWFKQIGDALSYCHKFGVAHRDIKCENLLINRGSIKLTDFGFACIIYDTETRRKLMSTTYCGKFIEWNEKDDRTSQTKIITPNFLSSSAPVRRQAPYLMCHQRFYSMYPMTRHRVISGVWELFYMSCSTISCHLRAEI